MLNTRKPPKSYANKWNRPKYWRLRGTAADGLVVTLGRYETIEEAQADSNRLARDGGYRDLLVQALEVRAAPEIDPA